MILVTLYNNIISKQIRMLKEEQKNEPEEGKASNLDHSHQTIKCQNCQAEVQSISIDEQVKVALENEQISPELRAQALKIAQDLLMRVQLQEEQREKQEKIEPIFKQFERYYNSIVMEGEGIDESIEAYIKLLVQNWQQEQFFQHFVENQFLSVIMSKIEQHEKSKDSGEVVRAVFKCLEYLLKGLGSGTSSQKAFMDKEQQFIYLLVMLNKEGFIEKKYKFGESEDWAYYAHFIKLLVRIINQADRQGREEKEEDSKFLSIFFNSTQPEFPLLLILLKFYKWPDVILETSVKLCLLELGNHPSPLLQNYLLNFPFVTFYCLYCEKMATSLEKILELGSDREPHSNPSEKEQILIEEFTNDLKFIQDFMSLPSHNCTSHLNMYINSFASTVTRCFYQFMLGVKAEKTKCIINALLTLMNYILKGNSVLKIQLGFQEMFHKTIHADYYDFLKKKRPKLDIERYWIFDECKDLIREHSSIIMNSFQRPKKLSNSVSEDKEFDGTSVSSIKASKSSIATFSDGPPSQSILKTMGSYIPKSKSNWLYHEMRKISECIGTEIVLCTPLSHQPNPKSEIYSQSFLNNLNKIQELQFNNPNKEMIKDRRKSMLSRIMSPLKDNPLYMLKMRMGPGVNTSLGGSRKSSKVSDDDEEQVIYYYLMTMCCLYDRRGRAEGDPTGAQIYSNSIPINMNLEEVCELMQIAQRCRSLMIVGMMYWYIKIINYEILKEELESEENSSREFTDQLLAKFTETIHKLIYFILTEGWNCFIKRTRAISTIIWGQKDQYGVGERSKFSNDIFRDIECDILFFVILRHIFSTKNYQIDEVISDKLARDEIISKEIKVPCKLNQKGGLESYLVMDGQYVTIVNAEDAKIAGPLPVNSLIIYEEGNVFEFLDKSSKGQFFTVYIQEPLNTYVSKEIRMRRHSSMQIELSLRTLRFPIE